MDYIIIIFLFIAIISIISMNLMTYRISSIHSKIDEHKHLVLDLPFQKTAANIIAAMKKRLRKLVKYLVNKYKNDAQYKERVMRLQKKFNSENIREASPDSKYTSYSINKGEELHFCIRPKKGSNKKIFDFHKLNTLMFVAIHELAHIMSKTYGHNEEFRENFVFLLDNASKCGIYEKTDYRKNKTPFCGMDITNTPLSDKQIKELFYNFA